MPIALQDLAAGTFAPMLGSLSGLFDKAAAHVQANRLDERALVQARLAPDMYTLAQQVQQACSYALDAMARLAGEAPPTVSAEGLATLTDLQALIASTVATLRAARLPEAAEDQAVSMPLMQGLRLDMTGLEYLRDWSSPHFYFHVVTAYDILRVAGVELGKADYMSHVAYAIRPVESAAG